jgi:hypothetical protein
MMRPFFQVDEQHLARLQAPLRDMLFSSTGSTPGLGRHDHEVIVSDEVAGRAQAVAVQRRADLAAIGEGNGGGAVPRLHQAAWYS